LTKISGFKDERFSNLGKLTKLTVKLAQDWIATDCNEYSGKGEWPQNPPDVNPLECHVWGVMLEHYKTFHSKPKNIDILKKILQLIWD